MNIRFRSAHRAAPVYLVYSIALVIGLLLSCLTFSVASLVPDVRDDPTFGIDVAQHIVGQRYFIADTWHWPLLNTHLLGAPVGTNIAMTDSIPLMALAAKALRGFLPPGFHTIYLWLVISYSLQPTSAVFALRSAGERRSLPCLAAASIAASMPAWFARAGHSALSGHFLILLALGLSFQISAGRRGLIFMLATILLVASLLIHPYLMVMVAAMLGAAPVSVMLRGDRSAWMAGLGVGVGLTVTALVGILLGYAGSDTPAGFGVYSMNLLSPIYPAHSALFSNFGTLHDPTDGEYEGYNYLGCGLLMLSGVALLSLFRPGQVRALAHHGGLVLACIALTLLALSNHIYLGDTQILDLGPVPDAMQQLRASGRFFWPVAYVIVIASIAAISRLGLTFVIAGLLVAAILLQIADAKILRSEVHRVMHEPQDWRIEADRLRPLIASHRLLTILPAYGCEPDDNADLTQLLMLASEYLIPVNTAYVARVSDPQDCSDTKARAALGEGELRLFNPPTAALVVPQAARFCRASGDFGVCSLQEDKIRSLSVISYPALSVDTKLPMTAPGDVLVSGWDSPDEDGTWTDGDDATIAVALNPSIKGPFGLTLWGTAFAPKHNGHQIVTVLVNGRQIATWSVRDMTDERLHADIPADITSDGKMSIRFHIERPMRPIDRGVGQDSRRLGLLVTAFQIEAPATTAR